MSKLWKQEKKGYFAQLKKVVPEGCRCAACQPGSKNAITLRRWHHGLWNLMFMSSYLTKQIKKKKRTPPNTASKYESCFLGWMNITSVNQEKTDWYVDLNGIPQVFSKPPLCATSFSTVSQGVTGVPVTSIQLQPFKSTQVTCRGVTIGKPESSWLVKQPPP